MVYGLVVGLTWDSKLPTALWVLPTKLRGTDC